MVDNEVIVADAKKVPRANWTKIMEIAFLIFVKMDVR